MPDLEEVFRVATQKVRPDPQALERQLGRQRRRARRRNVAVYVVVATTLAAGGLLVFAAAREGGDSIAGRPTPSPAADQSLVSELEGIWSSGFSIVARFSADGTYAIDDRGNLGSGPAALGTYEVAGDTIRFTNEDGTVCPVGDEFAWRVDMIEGGRLQAVFTDGGCSEPVGSIYNLTRVSPRSPAGAGLARPEPGRDGDRPELAFDLAGIWLRQGTGELLRFGVDGSYRIDDGGSLDTDPDDVGRFAIDDRGTITFTSGAESRQCTEGDRTIWSNVRIAGTALRAEVREEACGGRSGAVEIWLLLSGG
ncbi:MAG TPA: hypothetical protein VLA90_08740 [Actinomycetota bacterium]|nr:hypothetical protein [Actinomycetota bacterium]